MVRRPGCVSVADQVSYVSLNFVTRDLRHRFVAESRKQMLFESAFVDGVATYIAADPQHTFRVRQPIRID